jgi:hypothetical protein
MNNMVRIPCANAHFLDRQQVKWDADEGEARFIEEYVAERIEAMTLELKSDGMVLEAIGEDFEPVADAYSRALLALFAVRNASRPDHSQKLQVDHDLDHADEILGCKVRETITAHIEKFATDELTDEAHKALETAKEQRNCSCRRTGRECVC